MVDVETLNEDYLDLSARYLVTSGFTLDTESCFVIRLHFLL